ncbi:MDR family MFS transporter [Streptomyces sp. NPDC054796]
MNSQPDDAAARAASPRVTGSRLTALWRKWNGGLNRTFWAVWAATLVNQLGAMVIPYLGYYMSEERHVSLSTVGVILAVSGLGSVISQLCGGFFVDRFGYRVTMTAGMVGTGVFLFLLGAVDHLAWIAVFVLLVGVMGDMHRPASATLVADLFPAAERPRAYGLLYWAVNLGYAFSMVSGGSLVRHGFTWLFWVNSVTCAAAGILVWRSTGTSGSKKAPVATRPGRYMDVIKDRLLLAYLGSWFAYGIVFCQSLTTLPLAMKLDGLSASSFGYVMAVNAIVIVAVQPVAGPLLTRRDHSRVLIGGILTLGLGFGCTAVVSTPIGYALTVALWTLGEIAVSSVNQAVIASFAPASLRGRYYGLYGMVWSTAMLTAPLVGTQLLEWGPVPLWTICALLCLGAATGQWLLRPKIRAQAIRLNALLDPSEQAVAK